jgi:ABC-type nitrate/sulfonate/bicarbonate transport system permease component
MRQRPAFAAIVAAIVLGGIGGLFVLAAAWEVAARAYSDPLMMPRLGVIADKALSLYGSTEFHAHAHSSFVALLRGFVTAAITGILFGFVLAQAPVRSLTLPIVSFLAAIPFVAAAPLIAIWYGLSEQAKVTAVAIAATLPITRGMMVWLERHGFGWPASAPGPVAHADRAADRVALTVGAVVSGLRQGFAVAVAALVMVEFVASRAGLGHYLLNAMAQFDVAGTLATLLAIALPTALAALILDSIERELEARLR